MQEFLPITEVQARQRSQGNLTNGGSFLRPSHCRGQAHVQKTDKEQLAGLFKVTLQVWSDLWLRNIHSAKLGP